MAVPNNSSLSAEHRRHDRLLVARFAVGDIEGAQEHEAQELVRRCSECAALAADIKAISNSVAQMPAPARTKDFRLTADQADQLHGSRFDRWLRTLSGSSWKTVRPVAAMALSVGLVMSVVGFLPILGATGAAAPAGPPDTFIATQPPLVAAGNPTPESTGSNRIDQDPGAVPSSGQGAVRSPGDGVESSVAGSSIDNAYLIQQTAAPERQNPNGPPPPQPSAGGSGKDLTAPLAGASASPTNLILLAGLAVTLLAVIVLGALYAARRRFYDPLLR